MKRLFRYLLPNPLWNRLRHQKLKFTLARYPIRQVTQEYGGVPLTLELPDPLAGAWYGSEQAVLPELSLLRSGRLISGARVFDLGAHHGVVALQLAHAVGEKGLVIAVEANGHNAAAARRNCELNACGNVRVVHAAVSQQTGNVRFTADLNGSIDDGSNSAHCEVVSSCTIDELADRFGFPDVLYIDIEGYEARALSGGEKTLTHRPDCFVEVHVNYGLERFGGSVEHVLAFFPKSQYKLFIYSEQDRDPRPFNEDSHLLRDRFFLIALAI